MTSSMEKKQVHYTEREKILLATLVKDHPIIEDKRTDAATVHGKQNEWTLLTKIYNSQPETIVHRSSVQLKTLWKNLKQKKRKQTTLGVNLALKTGGGPLPKLKEDPILELVGDSAPYMDVVLINNFDSTASLENPPSDLVELDVINNMEARTFEEPIAHTNILTQTAEPTVASCTDTDDRLSASKCTTKRKIVNTEANLRVQRVKNLMEGDEKLNKIRLETAMIEHEKALEELKKAQYEAELAKLTLEC